MNLIGINVDETRIDGHLDRLESDLNHYRKIGINAVELPIHGFDTILNGRLNSRKTELLIPLLKSFDFDYSIHCPNPVNLMDRHAPELHRDVLMASLAFARQINSRVVVYHGGRFVPEEEFNLDAARSLTAREAETLLEMEAETLQGIAAIYPDIVIAVENARPYLSQSPYTYAERLGPLSEQVSRVNRDNVRINLDVGHLHMASGFYNFDPLEETTAAKHLIAHTHIHDNFGGVVHHWEKQQTHQLPFGKGDSHMPVGFGSVPIASILAILLPEYTGMLMMELRGRYFSDISTSAKTLSEMASASLAIDRKAG